MTWTKSETWKGCFIIKHSLFKSSGLCHEIIVTAIKPFKENKRKGSKDDGMDYEFYVHGNLMLELVNYAIIFKGLRLYKRKPKG